MNNAKAIILFMAVSVLLFSCKTTKVKIGTQTWAAKNLDVSTFRNGDTIAEAKTYDEWKKAGEARTPAWCYYDNNPENGKKHGKLYNWYTVNDSRGLAPGGWHVPTDAEWTMLTDYLGGAEVAGTKMKNTKEWNDFDGKAGNGTNKSRFAGFPSGYRYTSGAFMYIGGHGGWWSSSGYDVGSAWSHGLHYNSGRVVKGSYFKSCGYSIRLVKD